MSVARVLFGVVALCLIASAVIGFLALSTFKKPRRAFLGPVFRLLVGLVLLGVVFLDR